MVVDIRQHTVQQFATEPRTQLKKQNGGVITNLKYVFGGYVAMTDEKLARLREQRKAIDARIRHLQNKEREKARKEDTRRKILAGAWLLDETEKRPDFKEFVYKKLDSFLSKPDDRALFGLPPRTGTEQAEEKPAE